MIKHILFFLIVFNSLSTFSAEDLEVKYLLRYKQVEGMNGNSLKQKILKNPKAFKSIEADCSIQTKMDVLKVASFETKFPPSIKNDQIFGAQLYYYFNKPAFYREESIVDGGVLFTKLPVGKYKLCLS